MGSAPPAGVVGAIAPWNAALILSARSIAAPLALGNTVVLKPSEWSPYAGGLLWGEIFAEAGLPAGVLNIVTHAPGGAGADRRRAGREPAVRRINFTGSTSTGRRLAEAAGRHLEADRARARRLQPADRPRRRRPRVRGERVGVRRLPAPGPDLHVGAAIIVERSIADDFTERLAEKTKWLKAGDPKEHDTIIGPLINEEALATVRKRVEDAVAKGARVLAGGEAIDGNVFQATLIADVPEDSDSRRRRRSGRSRRSRSSTAPTRRARANATTYGLRGGILTSDTDRGFVLAQRLEAGIVHVNDQPVGDEPQMPFEGRQGAAGAASAARRRSTSSRSCAG